MKFWFVFFIVATLFFAHVLTAPADSPTSSTAKPGSQFISSFDEIVVQSSLRVKGKDGQGRQGRTKLVTVTPNEPSNTTTTNTPTTTKVSSK